jgi:hypothetical protein
MELVKVVPGSDSETCHDGNQISIKDEDVTDIEEDENPLLISSPVIKSEEEVSPCLQHLKNVLDMQIACFLTCLCLSIHMKQDPYGDWIEKNLFQNSKIYIFVVCCLCSTCFRQSVSRHIRLMILHID